MVYLNASHIQWYSKKQFMIETSVCMVEFVAMMQDIDVLRDIRKAQHMSMETICQLPIIFQSLSQDLTRIVTLSVVMQ